MIEWDGKFNTHASYLTDEQRAKKNAAMFIELKRMYHEDRTLLVQMDLCQKFSEKHGVGITTVRDLIWREGWAKAIDQYRIDCLSVVEVKTNWHIAPWNMQASC